MNGNGTAAVAAVAATNGNGVAHENGHAKVNGTNGHINGSRGKYLYSFFFLVFKTIQRSTHFVDAIL